MPTNILLAGRTSWYRLYFLVVHTPASQFIAHGSVSISASGSYDCGDHSGPCVGLVAWFLHTLKHESEALIGIIWCGINESFLILPLRVSSSWMRIFFHLHFAYNFIHQVWQPWFTFLHTWWLNLLVKSQWKYQQQSLDTMMLPDGGRKQWHGYVVFIIFVFQCLLDAIYFLSRYGM